MPLGSVASTAASASGAVVAVSAPAGLFGERGGPPRWTAWFGTCVITNRAAPPAVLSERVTSWPVCRSARSFGVDVDWARRETQALGPNQTFGPLQAVPPLEAASFTMMHDEIVSVLRTLSARERRVLELRFGLTDGHPRTLEEVGREFGITRERIRQIEAKTLCKLRHPSRAQRLRDYLDV